MGKVLAYWAVVRTWVWISSTHIKPNVVAHICNLRTLWHMGDGTTQSHHAFEPVKPGVHSEQQRRLVSNKLEGEDQPSGSSFHLCTHATPYADRKECNMESLFWETSSCFKYKVWNYYIAQHSHASISVSNTKENICPYRKPVHEES